MDFTTQQQLFDEMHETLKAVSISKGADYADTDMLANFKTVSTVVSLLKIDTNTPEGYAMLMVILKLQRINNLLSSGKAPSNEAVGDSFLDGINYFRLAFACYAEKKFYGMSSALDEDPVSLKHLLGQK